MKLSPFRIVQYANGARLEELVYEDGYYYDTIHECKTEEQAWDYLKKYLTGGKVIDITSEMILEKFGIKL